MLLLPSNTKCYLATLSSLEVHILVQNSRNRTAYFIRTLLLGSLVLVYAAVDCRSMFGVLSRAWAMFLVLSRPWAMLGV